MKLDTKHQLHEGANPTAICQPICQAAFLLTSHLVFGDKDIRWINLSLFKITRSSKNTMIVSVYQCNCAYTYIATYIHMYMDAIYVCSVLRIHFFMHLANYAPFVCLSSLVCARVHLYIHICVYIHIRFSLRFSRFLGFRLGTYAFDVSIAFGIKSNRLRRNMPFCCLSQHWFLYSQIFQPEEPTSYTSTICHPGTSSSRKAALGEGICVGTGKSAGEDLGKTHSKAMELHKKQLRVVILYIWSRFPVRYHPSPRGKE